MMVHLNGQFLHQEKALISPDDRGFLFGDGVYEVVRASKGRLFRAAAHWQRLKSSLAAIGLNGPDEAECQVIAEMLLERNALQSAEVGVLRHVGAAAAAREQHDGRNEM